jgi:hypothetical protein
VVFTPAAPAELMLTSAGVAKGFELTTFATGFPSASFGAGPFGIVFPAGGGVLVSDAPGNVRLFPTNANNQLASSAPVGGFYGFLNAEGMAIAGGNIYMVQGTDGNIRQINSDGSSNQVIVSGLPSAVGIVTNPANGHLFVSNTGTNKIVDIDPVARTTTLFVTAPDPDGLTISPDGSILYAAVRGAGGGGHLIGYDTSTRAIVFDSGPINGVDGTALGVGGMTAGNIYANTLDGRVVEVNLTTLTQTVIATGGSRGDFVAVDPYNGTLLLTQTDRIMRLGPPGIFAVPEPNTWLLFASGALALIGYGWRWRKRA